jgi:dTDP-4-amino-4,6-dideoxygalactose transaminase
MRRRMIIMQNSRRLLAIDGGVPLLPDGPPGWPPRDDHVRANLLEAYERGAWAQYHGPYVEQLEEVVAKFHQVPHALSCASGTIAVELALRALKVGEGDEVILAGYDFGGNFRAIEAVGALPVLVDLAPGRWTLDPAEVERAIGPQTRAIIASHLHSSIAPMPQLVEIARRRGLVIVEDACQAQGAMVAGRIAGTWGDVGVWSFGGSKLLTAGRGGAIFTSNADAHQRAKIYCERGNHAFPLSELQAAVLLPQIAKLAHRNERRQRSASFLLEQMAAVIGLGVTTNGAEARPAYYKMSWWYDSASCGEALREEFIVACQAEGIALDTGFRGFSQRPSSRCRKVGELANSQRASEATLTLHHPVLLEPAAMVHTVGEALIKVAEAFAASRES